jgi:hypothetical protein
MERITIDGTDVLLDDLGEGRGKIIIANSYGNNYSTYWGSMNSSLREFLLGINESYFTNRLTPPTDRGEFCGKRSVRNVRQHIKTELSYEIPWYKFMETQKSLRGVLKDMERCESDSEFVSAMSKISNAVDYSDLDRWDEEEFRGAMESLECEPWHFIEMGPSHHTLFLNKLFKNLQKCLRKNVSNLETVI